MIVDASVVADAVADPGPRGAAAPAALAALPDVEPLVAPGHLAVELLSGLGGAALRADHPLSPGEVGQALRDAEALEVRIEAVPWSDVHRAWELAQGSLRYTDAVYVAAAERHRDTLMTADARIERPGAPITCEIITVSRSD